MLLSLCWCQIRHIHHASINITTSILGGRSWHGIWGIRWSPTMYWRSLQIWCCVWWRSGWLLKNRGHLRWINYWIIQWRRHSYHQWWQLIALWVTLLAIKVPVITRIVLWRTGWLLTNRGHLRWINHWIIIWRRHNDNSLIFEWLSLKLKKRLSQRVVRCLPWFFPVTLLWRLPIPFGRGMMNKIWVCGGVVCLLFCLLLANKRWEPIFFGATTAFMIEF